MIEELKNNKLNYNVLELKTKEKNLDIGINEWVRQDGKKLNNGYIREFKIWEKAEDEYVIELLVEFFENQFDKAAFKISYEPGMLNIIKDFVIKKNMNNISGIKENLAMSNFIRNLFDLKNLE